MSATIAFTNLYGPEWQSISTTCSRRPNISRFLSNKSAKIHLSVLTMRCQWATTNSYRPSLQCRWPRYWYSLKQNEMFALKSIRKRCWYLSWLGMMGVSVHWECNTVSMVPVEQRLSTQDCDFIPKCYCSIWQEWHHIQGSPAGCLSHWLGSSKPMFFGFASPSCVW